MYRKYTKRLLDVIFSVILLAILSPVFLVTAILVRTKLGRPVIFRQQRPGKDEKIFTMYKFRTMTDGKDENGNFLPDSERLTSFGRKLRSTSIDELPELVNIVKGEMSFVGPRPLLVEYLPLYSEEQHHRHDVRPGLTGLAQVKGRNGLEWEEKFSADIEYVEKYDCAIDFKILCNTVNKVLKKEGITDLQTETMQLFKGNK